MITRLSPSYKLLAPCLPCHSFNKACSQHKGGTVSCCAWKIFYSSFPFYRILHSDPGANPYVICLIMVCFVHKVQQSWYIQCSDSIVPDAHLVITGTKVYVQEDSSHLQHNGAQHYNTSKTLTHSLFPPTWFKSQIWPSEMWPQSSRVLSILVGHMIVLDRLSMEDWTKLRSFVSPLNPKCNILNRFQLRTRTCWLGRKNIQLVQQHSELDCSSVGSLKGLQPC
jgi:hypothetical protein